MGATSLRQAIEVVGRELFALVPGEVAVPVADELVGCLARCEHQMAAVRLRLARRVTGAGAHRVRGDRDPASYLARRSGTSPGKARAELALAERLAALPAADEAFAAGVLSPERAAVVVQAAAVNPAATGDLLARAAGAGTLADLRQAAARAAQAVRSEEDEVARERRLHARRYCRTWTPAEGGLRIDALLGSVDGARVLAALTKRTGELLGDRGDPGSTPEPVERLRADALVGLCGGEAVRTELIVHVDAATLVRGERVGDEVCEVAGVGPLSATAARSLLGEGFMTLLVHRGADVATVTSTTRVVPKKVRQALVARDRCCVVPGCGATVHLEIDHWRLDYAKGGLTELANLCRLCRGHHALKTAGLLHLDGGPGQWRVTPGPCAIGAPRAAPRAGAGPPG